MWVTSNYVNCSRRNPKRSAQCVYHTETLVYSTARAGISCIKKEGPINNSSITRWTFQSLSMSSRREDFMDIDMVKNRETNNILRLTICRRHAKRVISKESMTDSYDIKKSVFEWLKIIETKIFVDDGMMLLRIKITLTIWPHKSTSTVRANGGFIQISKVPILCHWGIDLISSRHCLLCNDCNKKQEKNHRCLLTLTNNNNGRHAVHLLHGGIGKVHGGLFILPKVTLKMHQVSNERCELLFAVFGKRHRKRLSWIQFILSQIGRLQLTVVYCNRQVV